MLAANQSCANFSLLSVFALPLSLPPPLPLSPPPLPLSTPRCCTLSVYSKSKRLVRYWLCLRILLSVL